MMSSTCKVCNGKFYLENGSYIHAYICPQCKRDEIKQKNAVSQVLQNKSEDVLNQRDHYWEQQRMQNRAIEFERSNREYEQREQKKEYDLSIIKEKIYNIAQDKQTDIEHISKLIKLLLHQHNNYINYIYENIIILDSPYDKSIVEILRIDVKKAIDNSNLNSKISFEQKALDYFSDKILNCRYKICLEFLLNKNDFFKLVNEKLEVKNSELERNQALAKNKQIFIADLKQGINKVDKTRLKDVEENQIANDIYNIEKDITVDKLAYKILNKKIGTINIFFGDKDNVMALLFPRINLLYLVILLILHFCKIGWLNDYKINLLILGTGYLVTWIFRAINDSNEKKINSLCDTIKENEIKLIKRNYDLERKNDNQRYDLEQNNENELNNLKQIIEEEERKIEKLNDFFINIYH